MAQDILDVDRSLLAKVEKWVESFNRIPKSLLEKAYRGDPGGDKRFFRDITEMTPLTHKDEAYEDFFPIWDTLWMFNDEFDESLLDELEVRRAMAGLGFRIYEAEEGYFFGIEAGGNNFYVDHWVPLYKAFQDFMRYDAV